MNLTYRQTTGQMVGQFFGAQGYSGRGEGLNNPAMQHVHGTGPLPQGEYTIMPPHTDPKLGPLAFRLIPAKSNVMYGRADFFIHAPHANDHKDSSEGCIVMEHDVRVAIAAELLAGYNQLTVIA